jgi:hypothetical protein
VTSPYKAAAFCLAFLGVFRASAQEAPAIPEGLRDKALSVSICAYVAPVGQTPAWYSESARNTMPGVPVSVKLVGENLAILIQVTPYDEVQRGELVIVTQGQVWVKRSTGELSYHSTLDSATVGYGEKVLFFPLGRSSQGSAPMRIEIVINHYKAAETKPAAGETAKPGQPPPRLLAPPPPAAPDPSVQGQPHSLPGSSSVQPPEPSNR